MSMDRWVGWTLIAIAAVVVLGFLARVGDAGWGVTIAAFVVATSVCAGVLGERIARRRRAGPSA